MSRYPSVAGRKVAQAQGDRVGAPGTVPFLVLDLGRGCDPHQARCRRCRWRSGWQTTAAQAQVEHSRHEATAHRRGQRPARRRRLGLVVWGRPR